VCSLETVKRGPDLAYGGTVRAVLAEQTHHLLIAVCPHGMREKPILSSSYFKAQGGINLKDGLQIASIPNLYRGGGETGILKDLSKPIYCFNTLFMHKFKSETYKNINSIPIHGLVHTFCQAPRRIEEFFLKFR
jgi:hypothetical protein